QRSGGRRERAWISPDPSAALAQLLAEDRLPPEALWQEPLISSRLIECEIWTRIHSLKLARSPMATKYELCWDGLRLSNSPCRSWRALWNRFPSQSERSMLFISRRWTLSRSKGRA